MDISVEEIRARTDQLIKYEDEGDEEIPEESKHFVRWSVEKMRDPEFMKSMRREAVDSLPQILDSMSDAEIESRLIPAFKDAGREYGVPFKSARQIAGEIASEALDYAIGWVLVKRYREETGTLEP